MSDPLKKGAPVVPHDTNPLAATTSAVYVGGAGNLEVQLENDSAPWVINAVAAGTLLPIAATRILANNTTATNISSFF